MASYGDVPGSPPLVVMTYNIHHGRGTDGKVDMDRISQVITEASPHIVCLQEVDRNLPRTAHEDFPALLSQKTRMQAFFGANYYFDGGEYGNATLSAIPVLGHRNVALPNPMNEEPRGCLVVTVEWAGQPVEIMNTHWGLKGLERFAQAEAIVRAKHAGPTILAGDLNETRHAPGLQIVLRAFSDVFLEDHPSPGGTISAGSPSRRIDFILVDDHFDVVDATIVYSGLARIASDHLPVVAHLRLRPPSEMVRAVPSESPTTEHPKKN